MGFLDGVSSSQKQVKVEDLDNKKGSKPNEVSEDTEYIDVFGDDIDGDGIGDNIELNTDNLQGNAEDGYYVEVDTKHNNSLYAIMQNTYSNWDDMSYDEQNALIDAVMDANPELFGTGVNNVSNQYVTDSERGSMDPYSTVRSERMHSYIYAGDKINIPTKETRVETAAFKQASATANNSTENEHVHVATVIATAHGTTEYVYEPSSASVELNSEEGGAQNLSDVVSQYFDAEADEQKAYAIALDQAKANSEFVLTRINSATRENYDDVADIPADVLLNTKLCVDSKYANNEMSLVDSRYEDFADGTDLSSGRYVDQQMFTSQVSDVTIDPNFEGESGDMVDGKPVYKSVEDAILANYRTEVDAKDVDTSKYGEVSYVKGGGSSEIETVVYKNGTEVYRDRNTGEIKGASVAVEKDSDAYAAIMDGLKDNPANASIVKGKSGQDAIDALNEISGTQSLNLQPTELQRIAVGCDEKTAKQLFADGKDTEFSYLHSTVDKVDMSEKTDDGEYKYQSMMDLMEFYADPSDEAAQNGKSLLDRYNESPNDPETQALIGAAVKNIITNNDFFKNSTFEVNGEEVKGEDLTVQQAMELDLIDKNGNPIIKGELELGDAAYNITSGTTRVVKKKPTPVSTPKPEPEPTPEANPNLNPFLSRNPSQNLFLNLNLNRNRSPNRNQNRNQNLSRSLNPNRNQNRNQNQNLSRSLNPNLNQSRNRNQSLSPNLNLNQSRNRNQSQSLSPNLNLNQSQSLSRNRTMIQV